MNKFIKVTLPVALAVTAFTGLSTANAYVWVPDHTRWSEELWDTNLEDIVDGWANSTGDPVAMAKLKAKVDEFPSIVVAWSADNHSDRLGPRPDLCVARVNAELPDGVAVVAAVKKQFAKTYTVPGVDEYVYSELRGKIIHNYREDKIARKYKADASSYEIKNRFFGSGTIDSLFWNIIDDVCNNTAYIDNDAPVPAPVVAEAPKAAIVEVDKDAAKKAKKAKKLEKAKKIGKAFGFKF